MANTDPSSSADSAPRAAAAMASAASLHASTASLIFQMSIFKHI